MAPSGPADILKQQLHAMAANGIKHFPKPSATPISENATPTNDSSTATIPSPSFSPETFLCDARACQRCQLAAQRKRVVVAEGISQRAIMVIADFPDAADEDGATTAKLFEQSESAAGVLGSLLDRLDVDAKVHRSFAVKCAPRKGIPNNAVACCAALLSHEISLVDPDVILAFGHRSLTALEEVASSRLPAPVEIGDLGRITLNSRERQIFLLPSPRELERYKEWRGPVWAFLQVLKAPSPRD